MEKRELKEGEDAPEFCLTDQNENKVCSADLRGKWTVLYFYPRDNTPGCTREAKDLTCSLEEFGKLDTRIVGISPDSGKSHLKFIDRHELKILLLSDPDHVVLENFGAWKPKKLYGREFMGVVRSTFLIDPNWKIRKVWPKVKVKGHVDDVLRSLKDL